MASLFHTHDVVMAGVDIHAIDGPLPCAVGKPFDLPPDNFKYTMSVTGHGFPLVQRDFKGEVVPHLTLPLTPEGVVRLALANLSGTTQCALAVESVSAEGAPLACSIEDLIGLNLNCQSIDGGISAKLPTGVTFSYYPLMTEPTVGDWLAAARTMLVESLWSTVVDQVLRKAMPGNGIETTVLQKLIKKFFAGELQARLRQVSKVMDHWVDSKLEGYVDTALV